MHHRKPHRWILAVLAACVLFFAPAPANAADVITLTSGLEIEGDITVENESLVKIRVEGRVMQFPRRTISNIEYGPDSTAPSQVKEREEESKEDLKQAQRRVRTIKVRQRPKKEEEKEEEEELAEAPVGGVNPDGTIVVPDRPRPEEEKWIEELRTGSNKIQACRELARLDSVYALPTLIRALDDESVYVRREAHEALQKITGQDFGYQADSRRRSDRVGPIEDWQEWYEDASGKKVPW